MKTTLFIFLAVCLANIYSFGQSQMASVMPEKNAPAVSWSKMEHDFGKIRKASPATAEFTFKNTGKTPVLIAEVKGSCGCTATSYSKDPVKPGESSKISATYDAAREGIFNKTVTVKISGQNEPVILHIKGEVVAD